MMDVSDKPKQKIKVAKTESIAHFIYSYRLVNTVIQRSYHQVNLYHSYYCPLHLFEAHPIKKGWTQGDVHFSDWVSSCYSCWMGKSLRSTFNHLNAVDKIVIGVQPHVVKHQDYIEKSLNMDHIYHLIHIAKQEIKNVLPGAESCEVEWWL